MWWFHDVSRFLQLLHARLDSSLRSLIQESLFCGFDENASSDAEGAASQELKRLSLGILLLAPLPDVPGFEIHLDKDMPSNCSLLRGGTVDLSNGAPCVIIACWCAFFQGSMVTVVSKHARMCQLTPRFRCNASSGSF